MALVREAGTVGAPVRTAEDQQKGRSTRLARAQLIVYQRGRTARLERATGGVAGAQRAPAYQTIDGSAEQDDGHDQSGPAPSVDEPTPSRNHISLLCLCSSWYSQSTLWVTAVGA